MSEPFIAQVMIFGFNFAPRDWAFCNGAIMSIGQNTALFSLVGTTYGGNGQTTFGLPNLVGRGVMNMGQAPGLSPYELGEVSGEPSITLSQAETPPHNHTISTATGSTRDLAPSANGWLGDRAPPGRLFSSGTSPNDMFAPDTLTISGGSQPHENQQPYVAMNYCIALYGSFPTRN